jgi:hypothetical protein
MLVTRIGQRRADSDILREYGRMDERWVTVTDVLRYARRADTTAVELDGYWNYYFFTNAPGRQDPRLMLEAGINPTADIMGPDGLRRRPVIAIRSSPWKAGHETNPGHDEFDLDRALLAAWQLHGGTDRTERLLAPPLVLFRSRTVEGTDGKRVPKGHVEFCGVGIIERLEHVVQRDPATGRSFPNFVLDLNVIDLAATNDRLDWRWIDDRRDVQITAGDSLRHAPASWRRWVEEGRAALPRIRRRVLSSRVLSHADQQPAKSSVEAEVLATVYQFFNGRKHSFELLAARVAGEVLGRSGMTYREGWLTRAGGDGGLDFVGRLDVGMAPASTPLVVLGQAKCVLPTTGISPDEVARVVARLRRGWLGVFVTTGSFSRQAQVEVIDDQYPLVLIPGGLLAEQVRKMAHASYGGDVESLLLHVASDYQGAVTFRRPEEILSS